MIVVFVCKLDINKEDILLDKMSLLSLEELEKVNRFRFKEDRLLSFLGKAMLKCFKEEYRNYSDGEIVYLKDYDFITKDRMRSIKLEYNEFGKPLVLDEDLYFNISHSGEYCVCAVGNEDMGIDIQKKKEIKYDFAKRYFHVKDLEHLEQCQGDLTEIIRIWSIKESFVKLAGKGMAYGMDKFYCDYDRNLIIEEGEIKANYNNIFENNDYVCYLSRL